MDITYDVVAAYYKSYWNAFICPFISPGRKSVYFGMQCNTHNQMCAV